MPGTGQVWGLRVFGDRGSHLFGRYERSCFQNIFGAPQDATAIRTKGVRFKNSDPVLLSAGCSTLVGSSLGGKLASCAARMLD